MFYLPEKFAYLVLCLPFLVLNLLILYFNAEHRRAQIKMSLLGAVVGPLSEVVYFADYWTPQSNFYFKIGNFPVLLEDVIFGFAVLGIASVIFDMLFEYKKMEFHISGNNNKSIIFVSILFVLSFLIFLMIGINSIFASSFAMLLSGGLVIYIRKDLIINAVLSALSFVFVVFVIYSIFLLLIANIEQILSDSWYLYGTSLGIRFLRVPVTELVWAFSTGFFVGPLYKFKNNTSYYF